MLELWSLPLPQPTAVNPPSATDASSPCDPARRRTGTEPGLVQRELPAAGLECVSLLHSLASPGSISFTDHSRQRSLGFELEDNPVHRIVSVKLVDAPDQELRATAVAFRDACQKISKRILEEGLPLNFFAIRAATYRTLDPLPSEMRCNASKLVWGVWKSWRVKGARGSPPHVPPTCCIL